MLSTSITISCVVVLINLNSKHIIHLIPGEPDPVNLSAGIQTNSLHKDFKKRGKEHRIAVNNLTVNFYRGQITALLGENGAGKTTMMYVYNEYIGRGFAYLNRKLLGGIKHK